MYGVVGMCTIGNVIMIRNSMGNAASPPRPSTPRLYDTLDHPGMRVFCISSCIFRIILS